MIVYEDKKRIVEVTSKDGIYENEEIFSRARNYDKVKAFLDTHSFWAQFFCEQSLANEIYNYYNSDYCDLEEKFAKEERYKNIANNNSIEVDIKLTHKRTGKSKTYKSIRYNNKALESVVYCQNISWYLDKLYKFYNESCTNGKVSDNAVKTVELLLSLSNKCRDALMTGTQSDKCLKDAKELIALLVVNVELETLREVAYGYRHIKSVKPFTEKQICETQEKIDGIYNTQELEL